MTGIEILTVAYIFLAAAVAVIFSFLWYGPLFGKKYMKASKMKKPKKKDKECNIRTFYTYLINVVIAFTISIIAMITGVEGLQLYALVILSWVGFTAATWLEGMLWEKGNYTVFAIGVICNLIKFLIIAFFVSL